RDQRYREREDREADLRRPPQRGLERRHALLDVPHNVLDHHDGVVHHEAGGNSQRHQREVVEAVPHQVHYGKSPHQRHGHGHTRNDGGGDVAQEEEDHHHHQAHREQQLEL